VFVLDQTVGRVRIAFTDRHGGVSEGAGSSLDLAGGTDGAHSSAAAAANIGRVAAAFGVPPADVVSMRQVHGRRVVLVDADTPGRPAPTADALVTDTPGLVLLARAADCVPVAVADPVRGLVAVVHSGRPGTKAGVVSATVARMRAGGGEQLQAWIGPRVCGGCYEVPAAMRAEVAAVEPTTWSTTRSGTPGLDLAAGVRAQLRRAGVAVHDLADRDGTAVACTMESPDLFSHRRQGPGAGRLGALAQVQR